jgi:hypothetical protein
MIQRNELCGGNMEKFIEYYGNIHELGKGGYGSV